MSGAGQVSRLREQLTCPRCGYLLRGLPGDVVTCPECGTLCDLPRLMMRRWTGPWQRAPGYSRLLWPVALAFGGGLPVLLVGALEAASGSTPLATLGLLVIGATGWLLMMWRLWAMMPNGLAVWLSLLAHVLAAGYVTGVLGIVRVSFAGWVGSVPRLAAVIVGLLLVGLLVLCRRGERFIAERCIRHHLNQEGTSDKMAA